MTKKVIYTDAPDEISASLLQDEEIVDFLPPPNLLVKNQPKVKITISLNSQSVDFFKKSAKKYDVKYQTMINEVLDLYVQKYNQ
ncbi:MAG TPA: BrnA antitoxin family protein [Treponemataceae bacterium]|nr:BrnA antitoxin family protein [Treponemataceae bacterium]